MKKLTMISVLVAMLAVALASPVFAQEKTAQERNASQSDPQAVAGEDSSSWPVLRYGQRNEDVKSLQHLLRHRGHANYQATGYFGDLTRQSVKDFQRSRGLRATGIVGDKTWLALVTPLRHGASNQAVYALQVQLHDNGYNIATTGYFGDYTHRFVKDFQKDHALAVTGKVNTATWKALLRGPYPELAAEESGGEGRPLEDRRPTE